MSLPRPRKVSSPYGSATQAGVRAKGTAATTAPPSIARHWRRSCVTGASSTLHEPGPASLSDRLFFLLLIPLAAISLPSLAFCALQFAMWAHGFVFPGPSAFHLPPQTVWDHLLAAQALACDWVSRWNSLATLTATGFLVCTLLRPRWRSWAGLALVPYGVLLCADFTLRWRPLP